MKTRTGVRLGISLPQNFPEERIDHGYLRAYVQAAEAAGFEDAWLTEGILTACFRLEPVSYLSWLAAVTERIRFGVAVVILNTRNPVQLAKSLATLDQLSKGRVTLGVGLGGGTQNYAAFGVPAERRVARFEEALKVMKALWTEDSATLPGEFWRLQGAHMKPKPVQKPHIPVIFGGHSEGALRRAVRMGDGWIASGSTSTEKSLQSLKEIRGYLKEAGRDESKFLLSKRLYIAVDDDEGAARQKMNEALTYHYGGDPSAMGLAASPSRAVEALSKIREAGAQHILLNPCYDHMKQMEVLLAKVVPQL
jgi:probable F420-dependent oxidoreductase